MKRSPLSAMTVAIGLLTACAAPEAPRRPPAPPAAEAPRRPAPAPAPVPVPVPAQAPQPEQVVIVREPAPPTAVELETKQVSELIAYASRVAGMSADEQRKELAAASQEFARDNGARPRLRVAVLLALPGTATHDDGRALALLEPLASAGGSAPLRQFGWLLHGQVSERLREQKKAAQLKEQIDGLRAIERSLMERERGKK
jgi:hypothetical protein